jgi:hypothetical protein
LVAIAILSYMTAQPDSPLTPTSARRSLALASGVASNIAPGWCIPPKENISNIF